MPKKKPENLKYGLVSSENENKYQVKRTRILYFRPGVYINKETNADMVEFLKSKESISDYIISLIRADMTKEKR